MLERNDLSSHEVHIAKSSSLKTPDLGSLATNLIFKENKIIVQAKKNSSISCFILISAPGPSGSPKGTAMGHQALWDTELRPQSYSSLKSLERRELRCREVR